MCVETGACSRRHAALQHCEQAAQAVGREQGKVGAAPPTWGRYEAAGVGGLCRSARLVTVRAADGRIVGNRTGESARRELRNSF
jgi:hypothetical protein